MPSLTLHHSHILQHEYILQTRTDNTHTHIQHTHVLEDKDRVEDKEIPDVHTYTTTQTHPTTQLQFTRHSRRKRDARDV